MIPVVCLVGRSGVGKTMVVEKLVGELKRLGYRVATIKHDVHGFEIDQPGKDSWRHAQAGADCVVISSPEKLALIKKVDHDPTLGELALTIGPDYDIVVVEGFKQSQGLKIEVHRKGMGKLLCSPQELLAVVTDEALDVDVPQYSLDDGVGLAELLKEKLLDRDR